MNKKKFLGVFDDDRELVWKSLREDFAALASFLGGLLKLVLWIAGGILALFIAVKLAKLVWGCSKRCGMPRAGERGALSSLAGQL